MIKVPDAAALLKRLRSRKSIAVLLIAGALLLLLAPSVSKGTDERKTVSDAPRFDVEEEEKRLAAILSKTDGAGRVAVMLSVAGTPVREIACDEDASTSDGKTELSRKTVTVQTGGSAREVVTLSYEYPAYIGAVVVSDGAGISAVKLRLTQAVSSLTGLGADRITVIKMK
ncbi:MAG: hypothetical protein IK136_02305 [Oscillospiraceae bacterium]|nr:hypothetical protein [Oscillospiraceae bacterium]